MSSFGAYGRYYDLIYRDKDYAAEAEFVHALIQQYSPGAQTVLDLGCGTGLHAIEFVRHGYSVVGVDRSEDMLAEAQARSTSLGRSDADLRFHAGDIRNVRLDRTFDVVVALFHVMSYQTGNDDIADAFNTARAHVRDGGLFVFDCWYGPGVLTDPPQIRVKRFKTDQGGDVLRISEPTMQPNANTVDVAFTLLAIDPDGHRCEQIKETHAMRYLFAPEIEFFARAAGFDIVSRSRWLNRNELDLSCWNACFVARA
jgi:SAM-dependent methyltransferase